MAKPDVEVVAAQLRVALDAVEEAVQALIVAVERDEREDQVAVRAQLADLHAQAVESAERARGLLERVHAVVHSAEERVEAGSEAESSFEDLVSGLESAAEQLDPENWDWSDQ